MANKNNEFCCMCGSKKDEVDMLIKGKYGYICDNCISIASDLSMMRKRNLSQIICSWLHLHR